MESEPSECCSLQGEAGITDVLSFTLNHLDSAKTAVRVTATSKGLRDVCLRHLAGNSDAAKGFVLDAIDRHLSQVPVIFIHSDECEYRSFGSENYPGANCSCRFPLVDSTECKLELCWVYNVCGRGMLQHDSFAADVAEVCSGNIIAHRRCKMPWPDKMRAAATDVCSCFLSEGFRIPYKQLLAACRSGGRSEQKLTLSRSWISAHGKQHVPFLFKDEDLASYGLLNNDTNQAALRAAVVALAEDKGQAFAAQMESLDWPVATRLLMDLVMINKHTPGRPESYRRVFTDYLCELLEYSVGSDGLLQFLLQELKEIRALSNHQKWSIFDTHYINKFPMTSQQLVVLLDEVFDYPLDICDVLEKSQAFAGPSHAELFNKDSVCAIAATMRRCVSNIDLQAQIKVDMTSGNARSSKTEGYDIILKTLCGIVNKSKGHLIISSMTVIELISSVVDRMLKCAKLDLQHVSICSNIISCLKSVPAARDLPAAVPGEQLLSLLAKVAAPPREKEFIAVLKLVIDLAGGKQNITLQLAAEILTAAKATRRGDVETVSFAMAVVMLEFPMLQRCSHS